MEVLEIMRRALADARSRNAEDEYVLILAGIGRLQELECIADLDTVEMPVLCAWCLDEMAPNGEALRATSGESHGICPMHDARMRAQSAARRERKLARLASVA